MDGGRSGVSRFLRLGTRNDTEIERRRNDNSTTVKTTCGSRYPRQTPDEYCYFAAI